MPLSDAWIDVLAGWCSGATAVMALQPLDTILTRWQAGMILSPTVTTTATTTTTATMKPPTPTSTTLQQPFRTVMVMTTTATTTTLPTAAAAVPPTPHSTNNTTFSAVARMLTQQSSGNSIRALWRGASPMIGAVPIQNALLMGGYGLGLQYSEQFQLRNYQEDTDENTNSQHHHVAAIFVGGLVGGVLQSFLMAPVELVKVAQQCAGQSLPQALSHVLTHLHCTAGWKGLGATLLRDGIPHAVWFASYDVSKNYLSLLSQQQEMQEQQTRLDPLIENTSGAAAREQVLIPLFSGAFAATTAWTVGYPADLIKTRIQAAAAAATGSQPIQQQPLGIYQTAQVLIEEAHGNVLRGLYRGFGLKLVRAIPASMIGFTVYEAVKKQIVESSWVV